MNTFEKGVHEAAQEPAPIDENQETQKNDEASELFKDLKAEALRMIRKMLVYGGIFFAAVQANFETGKFVFEHKHATEYHTIKDLKAQQQRLKEAFGNLEIFPLKETESSLEDRKKQFGLWWPFVGKQDDQPVSEKRSAHERLGRLPETKIVGKFGGFEQGEMESVVRWLPSGWTEDVEKIEQLDTESQCDSSDYYGLGSNWTTLASATQGFLNKKSCVEFYKSSKEHGVFSNAWILFHEVAHANDWVSDSRMAGTERVNLLLRIADRLDDDDRFRSQYVESINNKDKNLEKHLKAQEYWAEISAAYFNEPIALYIKDYDIVNSHVRKTNPDFNNNFITKGPGFEIIKRVAKNIPLGEGEIVEL